MFDIFQHPSSAMNSGDARLIIIQVQGHLCTFQNSPWSFVICNVVEHIQNQTDSILETCVLFVSNSYRNQLHETGHTVWAALYSPFKPTCCSKNDEYLWEQLLLDLSSYQPIHTFLTIEWISFPLCFKFQWSRIFIYSSQKNLHRSESTIDYTIKLSFTFCHTFLHLTQSRRFKYKIYI